MLGEGGDGGFGNYDGMSDRSRQNDNSQNDAHRQEASELTERLRDILAERGYRDCDKHTWYKRIGKLPLYRQARVAAFRLQGSTFLVVHKQDAFIAEREADGFGSTYLMRKPAGDVGNYVGLLRSAYQRLS